MAKKQIVISKSQSKAKSLKVEKPIKGSKNEIKQKSQSKQKQSQVDQNDKDSKVNNVTLKKRDVKANQKKQGIQEKRGRSVTIKTEQKIKNDQLKKSNSKEVSKKLKQVPEAKKIQKTKVIAKSQSKQNGVIQKLQKKEDSKLNNGAEKRQKTGQNREKVIQQKDSKLNKKVQNHKEEEKKQTINRRGKSAINKKDEDDEQIQINTDTKIEEKKQFGRSRRGQAQKEEEEVEEEVKVNVGDKLRVRVCRKKKDYYEEYDSDENKKGKKAGKGSLRPAIPSQKTKDKDILPEFQVTVDEKLVEKYLDIDPNSEPLRTSDKIELLNTDCCTHCSNKNVIRAAMTDNLPLLEECFKSTKKISQILNLTQGPDHQLTPLDYAFKNGNMKMVDELLQYDRISRKIQRVRDEPFNIETFDTGMVSDNTYGTQVRKVNISRGNREGNNAFLKELVVEETSFRQYLKNPYFLDRVIFMEQFQLKQFQKLHQTDKHMRTIIESTLFSHLLLAGKRDIALSILEKYENDPRAEVNSLMVAVLKAKSLDDLPQNFNKLSVMKHSNMFGLTALHLAAGNENPQIYSHLVKMIEPMRVGVDKNGFSDIHFAAANKNPVVLKQVLQKTLNANAQATEQLLTPLMIAVKCNLPRNIEVFLYNDYEAPYFKNKSGWFPIHMAAKLGFTGCVRVFAEFDRQSVNFLSGYNKISPLMQAAGQGHFETVKFLVEICNCDINQVDKYNRNALIFAIRTGQVEIAAYLIKSKIFLHSPDTSMNTPLHYACAYGQMKIVELLLKCGADINAMNEWKYSPFLIAMLKNHKLITYYLLNYKDGQQVDVNGTDEEGRTILSYAVKKIDNDTLKFIKFLVKERGAQPNQADLQNRTPLFYLIQAQLPTMKIQILTDIEDVIHPEKGYLKNINNEKEIVTEVFKFLVDYGKAQLDIFDKGGKSLLSLCIPNKKLYLLPFFGQLVDINKNPNMLFELSPIQDSKNVQTLLKSHGPIEEQWINSLISFTETPLQFYIRLFTQQFQSQEQIKTYLYIRRLISVLQENENLINEYYDDFQSLEENKLVGGGGLFQQQQQPLQITNINEKEKELKSKIIISKNAEDFYKDLLEKELEEKIQLEIINKCISIQTIQNIYPIRIIQIIQNLLDLTENLKDEVSQMIQTAFYRQKAAKIIQQAKIQDPFIKFLKTLIIKGADPNIYGFNLEYFKSLKEDDQRVEIENAFNVEIFAQLKSGVYPFTRIESEKHAKNIDTMYQNLLKLQKDKDNKELAILKNGIVIQLLRSRNIELIEFILDQGVDVNQTNQNGETAFSLMTKEFADSQLDQYVELFNILKKYHINTDHRDLQHNTALLLAHLTNKTNIANFLFKQGLDINAQNIDKQTALLNVVQRKDYVLTEKLLEDGANPNLQDKQGRTALHYAVSNSSSTIDASFDMENLLLSFNADANIKDNQLRTPLHYAFVKIFDNNQLNTQMDPIETVSSLCTARNIDPAIKDIFGKTALHYAAQRGATISSIYLEKKGVELESKDVFGNTPLGIALLNKHSQYAIILIKQGSNVNQLVYPVLQASYQKYLDQNIEVEEQKNYQFVINDALSLIQKEETMFKLAVMNGELGLSYLLLDNGFDLFNAIEDSLQQKKFQLVLTLLSKVQDQSQLHRTNSNGQNLFHIFAKNAQALNNYAQKPLLIQIIKQFKRKGLNFNSPDINGRLPLHFACYNGGYQLIQEILKEDNYDFEYLDKEGNTPLISCIRGTLLRTSDNNCEAFKNLVTIGKCDYNRQYFESLYSSIDNSLTRESQMAQSKCLTTPFMHLIRSFSDMNQQLAMKWLQFFLQNVPKQDGQKKSIIFQQDTYGRDAIMYLAQQNELEPIKKIFELLEKQDIVVEIIQNQDILGRTAIHYVAKSNQIGTYDNVELLEFLIKKGFAIDKVNIDGQKPIDLVKNIKNCRIFRKLNKLSGGDKEEQKVQLNNKKEVISKKNEISKKKKNDKKKIIDEDQEMNKLDEVYDYAKDAEKFIELNLDKFKVECPNFKVQPDPIGQFGEGCQVVYEDEQNPDSAYDVYLIRMDTKGRHYYGACLAYKIQIVFDKNKDIYIVLTKWGSINENGMCQKTPFPQLEKAVQLFKSVFKKKTSNNWDEREEFEMSRSKNKYILYTFKKSPYNYKNILQLYNNYDDMIIKSTLSEEIKHLMILITNIGIYNEVVKMNNIETTKSNLINISQDNLNKAQQIMKEIENMIFYTTNYHLYLDQFTTKEEREDALSDEGVRNQVLVLSKQLYETLPIQSVLDLGAPRPIDRNNILEFKNKIYDIVTMGRACKILLGAQYKQNEISPLDYVYRSLQVDIQKLHDYESDYSIIMQQMKNTGPQQFSSLKIQNIYKINKKSETENFTKKQFDKDPLRMLLFHGTAHQNLLGILDCGLKLSPAGIHQNGQAFGSGIYFSSQFDKSISYARQLTPLQMKQARLWDKNINIDEFGGETGFGKRFMLICEVALGKIYKTDLYSAPHHYTLGTKKQLEEIDSLLAGKMQQIKNQQDEGVNNVVEDIQMNSEEYDYESDYSEDDENQIEKFDLMSKDIQDLANVAKSKFIKTDAAKTLRGCKIRVLANTNEYVKSLKFFDTMWVSGSSQPNPSFNLLMDDGCIVASGKPLNSQIYGGGVHSEFVVRDSERVKIRYIVEFDTKTEQEKKQENSNNSNKTAVADGIIPFD